MAMNWLALVDGPSAAIVLGGTALATVLRCGLADCAVTLRQIAALPRRGFHPEPIRAELAIQIQEIRSDGLLRAPSHQFGDREFDEATDALLHDRSLAALLAKHEAHRARRLEASKRAARTLAQAAELAPVFGLAGTLVSLSQLSEGAAARGALSAAIAMAVVTTLYGLLLANLAVAPLARMVERKARAEEAARQELIDWLAAQVAACTPRCANAALSRADRHEAAEPAWDADLPDDADGGEDAVAAADPRAEA